MVYSGPREYLPLLMQNRPLIPNRQRNQDTGMSMARQRRNEIIADILAQTLDMVSGTPHHFLQASIFVILAHIACGSNVALQRPLLEVGSMRIGGSMGALEPCSKLPAFPNIEGRY